MQRPSGGSVGRLLCHSFCGVWLRFDMALEPLGSEANLTACVCSDSVEAPATPACGKCCLRASAHSGMFKARLASIGIGGCTWR
jgi:hypothetical protein